jgi:hypothetical protein
VRELDPPQELWIRWAALAAALTTFGYGDLWEIHEEYAGFDDQGGQWARLRLISGDRAVLYGLDHEYSDTVMAEPPIDLLAGAPDWLPWDEVTSFAEDEILGYVYWHDGVRWGRAPYDAEDGLERTAGPVLSDPATLDELSRAVFGWPGHRPDSEAERARMAGVGTALLAAARARRVDAGVLSAYAGDLALGLAVARAGGLTPDRSELPRTAPGRRPATRTVRKFGEDDHHALIWDAMRNTPERPRTAPARTAALDAVQAYAREHGPVQFCMTATSAGVGSPVFDMDEYLRLSGLVRALREAEADARHGRWLFVHVEPGAVHRCYDSWPSWFDDRGPGRDDLATELAARDPAWRPAWAALLDDSIALEERREG